MSTDTQLAYPLDNLFVLVLTILIDTQCFPLPPDAGPRLSKCVEA